jgi:hypothetical protein
MTNVKECHNIMGQFVMNLLKHVGVKYPGYHRPPVTTQNSRYDWFPPVANGWGAIHPVPDKALPLQAEVEEPPA